MNEKTNEKSVETVQKELLKILARNNERFSNQVLAFALGLDRRIH